MAQLKKHYSHWIREGQLAEEKEEDLEKAAAFYEEAIRQKPLEALPFQRLMVIYRKLKEPGKELKTIDAGLRIFQDYYDQKPDKLIGRNSNAARLSKALLKSMTQNNKGAEPYYPEPIPAWLKRKETIEKKLEKKARPKKKTKK